MATWTNVPDSNLEPGDPIRSVDIIAIKDNPTALAEGASGAPEIYQKATQFSARAQWFTSNGTFTIPTGVVRLKVTVVGGGGGTSSTGQTSSVASGTQSITTISATGGGSNSAGLGSNGDINLRGGLPAILSVGSGSGTSTFIGGASFLAASNNTSNANNYGAGSGGSSIFDPCTGSPSLIAGGGGAGTAIKWLAVTGGTLTVTVGAGGTNAGPGIVIFEW